MATYYVDADNGNNSWDGLYPTYEGGTNGPKATAQFAYGFGFQPGDSLLFKRGTMHHGQVTITACGSLGNPIVVGAYGTGANPILTDGVIRTGWVDDGDGKYHLGSVTGTITNVTEDAGTTGGSLPHSLDSSLDTGNWYYDSGTSTLYYKPTTGVPTDHLVMTHAGVACYPYQNTSWLTFQDLTFIAKCGIYTHNGSESCHDILMQRCTFTDCSQPGFIFNVTVGYNNQNITVDNCLFQYNQNNFYFTSSWDAAVNDNIVIKNSRFLHTGETRHGGNWIWSGRDCDGMSFQNMTNTTIENNEISGCCYLSAGIDFWATPNCSSTNIIVRNNYIHDITHGSGIIIIGAQTSAAPYYQIYSNIIVNCAGSALWQAGLFLGRGQDPTHKSQIYNNTIWNCVNGILFNDGPNQNPPDYYVIKNNIIGGNSAYNMKLLTTILHNEIDYNDYYPTAGSVFYYNWSAVDWTTWKTDILGDSHSLTSDPLFVSVVPPDFHLQSTSPCINAGVDVGLTEDYEGNYMPQGGAPDIGVYEYLGNNMWF